MSGYRPEYTSEEQMQILNFIIDKKAYYDLRGTSLWKEMENSGEFDRSWQSLKEHFRKKIFPKLYQYAIPKEERENIKTAYEQTQAKANEVTKKPAREDIHVYDLSD